VANHVFPLPLAKKLVEEFLPLPNPYGWQVGVKHWQVGANHWQGGVYHEQVARYGVKGISEHEDRKG